MVIFPLLTLVLLLAAAGFCAWVYFRREFAVRGRHLLAATRALALLMVAAVLWNPDLRTGAEGASRYVLLDASESMASLDSAGNPLWDAASARARALAAEGARLLLFGSSVRPVHPDSLGRATPQGVASALAPAITTAAEAGAREIVVITDRRVSDPVAAAAAARRLGLRITVDDGVAESASNLALSRLVLPAAAEHGEAVEGRIEIEGWRAAEAAGALAAGAPAATPSSGEPSVEVVIEVDGVSRQTIELPVPRGGGVSSARFVLAEPLPPGVRRVAARLSHGDAFPEDDARVRVLQVGAEAAGVVLVSFAPDWEPRFLLPVLRQATGLPARGYLRVGPDRYLPMSASATAVGEIADAAELAAGIARAEVVVAMGAGGSVSVAVPLAAAIAGSPRTIIFPEAASGAAAGSVAVGGVAVGDPQSGEWYASGVSPSPIAGDLGGFVVASLPPLDGIMPLLDDEGGTVLEVRLGGAGEPQPALVLRAGDGGRRTAVALTRGFWRWASRDAEPQDRYRRLWSAVAGWLIADAPPGGGPGIRPVAPVLPRGGPLPWSARGREGQSARLAIVDSLDAVVFDSIMAIPPSGTFATPPLPPGRYSYEVAASDTTSGVFEVEAFSGEMLNRPVAAAELSAGGASQEALAAGSRPLRTQPWPYLFILIALCCEWTGRRRAGLR